MRFALTITAAAAAGLLAGCMGGDDSAKFDAAAYRAGDCRSAAAPVFEINQAVRPVVADKRDPGEAAETLKRSQRTLIEAMPGLTDLRADVQRVVDAVGFYRIGVDAQNFTPKLAKDVQSASDRLLTGCAA